MNENIIKFLKQQTCATISCVDEEGKPYCFNCFYAFNHETGMLYFKSTGASYHSSLLKQNPFVAGTILPDKLNKLFVKGVQFDGVVLYGDGSLTAQASGCYYKKHPMALAMSGELWSIQINHIKMTDSTKGFGTKITWERSEEPLLV
ncbi:MAG: pyridoxamine 5'-phosphate oxidase family protein [Mucilaginibacter sp.]